MRKRHVGLLNHISSASHAHGKMVPLLCNTDQNLLRIADPPSQITDVPIGLDNLWCEFYPEPVICSVFGHSFCFGDKRDSDPHLVYSINYPACEFSVPFHETTK